MLRRFHALPIAVLLIVATSGGCARSAGPAVVRAPSTDVVEEGTRFDPGPSSYGSEIGGLSQEDVEEQFQALRPRILKCVDRAAGRLSAIGGRVGLRMRLDREGAVRWVYLQETTLGDREAERCVLDVVRSRTWPRPLSGEGLAETSFEVEPSEVPTTWPSYKTLSMAQRAGKATRKCREGIDGRFQATAYVSAKGDVLAVGVAPPDENGEQAADCIADALRDLRVRSLTVAQRSTAKVSFMLP